MCLSCLHAACGEGFVLKGELRAADHGYIAHAVIAWFESYGILSFHRTYWTAVKRGIRCVWQDLDSESE